MYIVMNVIGLPFNGDTIKTQSLGGSESAGYYIARELAKRGHKVTIFTASKDEGVFEDVRYVWAGNCTKEEPFGERFHFYALRTQHDVCIIQRHPQAFAYRWASKINLLWLHDLALRRNAGAINNCLWNIDGVLPVSTWHGKQVSDVWGISPSIIYPVRNGVDLSLHNNGSAVRCHEIFRPLSDDEFKLLYAARPERGLENLVRPDGIMDRLAKISPSYHLYFCGYDNTQPSTRGYYEQLWQLAEERGNCTNLGSLTKQELADVERQCDLYVYPTTFEDTSCIMAMECAAAGLPFLSSEVGALPETTEGTGRLLIPLKGDECDIAAFVQNIKRAKNEQDDTDEGSGMPLLGALRRLQNESAKSFSWERAADTFEDAIKKCFDKTSSNKLAVLKHFEHVSDIYALREYEKRHTSKNITHEEAAFVSHINTVYAFAFKNTFYQHYKEYYEYEKQRGVNYGPESLDGNNRYESVVSIVSRLPSGSTVLDYGCAHGHYTVNLAKRFPELHFVGVDIAESNIAIARKWASDDAVCNVNFFVGAVRDGELQASHNGKLAALPDTLDCVIAAEVLEHVANPGEVADVLCEYLKGAGLFIATTPYGPWEAEGYKQHHPWRAHLWHFERGDLRDMFGMHSGFNIISAFTGMNNQGEVLGSYITTFNKPTRPSGEIDYDRKFTAVAPRQTVAACMIVKDAESTIRQALESFVNVVDEVRIGIDDTTTDNTVDVIETFLRPYQNRGELFFSIYTIPSPLKIGFDAARNKIIEKATSQWIFWPDADETLVNAVNITKYLRQNMYGGYALALRHFTMEPPGVLRTDLPTKLFRNGNKVKFFGMVHEHPETELNKGIGYVTTANDVDLSHFAYMTEEIRRKRFSRNLALMRLDREKNPDRILGKWLWVRDLAQMSRWELEQNGGLITQDIELRVREGLRLWTEVVEHGNIRLIMDGLQFYSELNAILGEGFDYGCVLDTSKGNGGLKMDQRQPIIGRFSSYEDAHHITDLLLRERTKNYSDKYF